MKNRLAHTSSRNKQGGYALLLVVFLLALLVVGTMSISLRVLTQGQREKEQEMIWRGKQYTRGIKLYYRKLGRFPNSMDDLVKPKVGNLRFMRQAYKDPMNKEDGSWRLIYVGPAGNLIGSLKPPQGGIQMPVAGGQAGGATGSTFGSFGSQPAPAPAGGIGAPGAPGAHPALERRVPGQPAQVHQEPTRPAQGLILKRFLQLIRPSSWAATLLG